MPGKISILMVSGTIDKLMAGAVITSGAVANDMEINVFFSFFGLLNLKKDNSFPQTLSYEGVPMTDQMMKVLKEKNVPSWLDMLKNAKETGNVKVYGCALMADLLGVKKDDLDPIVDDIVGVGEFVSMAEGGQILFI